MRSSEGEIGGEIEVARSSGEIERRGVAIDDRCDCRIGARSVVIGKVSSSSLFAIWALSLSLSLSLSLFWFAEAFGSLALSLSFAHGRKRFEGKINL